jgi:acyl carrier protein
MGHAEGRGSAVNRSEILAELKAMLAEFGDIDPEQVDEHTAFIADLALDSLVLVRMAVVAEERFEVRIPEEVAWELHTVGAVVTYVEDALAERTGAQE